MTTIRRVLSAPTLPHDSITTAFLQQDFTKDDTVLEMPVTASLAACICKYFNKRNRDIQNKVVREYMFAMDKGRWLNNHTPILIAFFTGEEVDRAGVPDTTPGLMLDAAGHIVYGVDGEPIEVASGRRVSLIDGQHRSLAAALAFAAQPGRIIMLTVRTGCSPALRPTLDCGPKRTIADSADLAGATVPKRSAAVIQALHNFATVSDAAPRKLGSSESDDYFADYHDALDWAFPLLPHVSAAITAAFVWAYKMSNNGAAFPPGTLDQVATQFVAGTGASDDPVWLFHKFCAQRDVDKKGRSQRAKKIRAEGHVVMTFRALNVISWAVRNLTVGDIVKINSRLRVSAVEFSAAPEGFAYFTTLSSAPTPAPTPVVAAPSTPVPAPAPVATAPQAASPLPPSPPPASSSPTSTSV
jgi:hypothetical protein